MMKFIAFILFFIFFFSVIPSADAATDEPTAIIIPRLSLSLPVERVPVVDGTWKVSTTAASFGVTSAVPGQVGNTVIFSHAKVDFFKSLPNLEAGDVVHVLTKNRWFTYKVYETAIVDPKDTAVLAAKNPYELTMYTCIGKRFEKRFVAKADLIATPFALAIEGRSSFAKASEDRRGVN